MATVLITGANRGIGLEFTKQYLARGETVVATCRDPQAATELMALTEGASRLTVLTLDVANEASLAGFSGQLGQTPVDIFVNNAGIYGPRSGFGDLDEAQWAQVFQVNSSAPLILTQIVIDNLRAGKLKKMVFLTSKMGSIGDNQGGGSYIYRSSKAALNAAVKSLSIDLADEGFLVGLLHPGWVRTDMGGPNGLIDATTSVSGLTKVIDELGADNTGSFFNYDGSIIVW
ncbi:MAG: NAD(P)-dependent dehydrogenase (short-subunit alcohol dehydrogenase family) [Pseudohongiellaceae bacterium]|jgi:NAD(P)-dependent dehydrogenase (short-subunit alcohol dehydrogenase family)